MLAPNQWSLRSPLLPPLFPAARTSPGATPSIHTQSRPPHSSHVLTPFLRHPSLPHPFQVDRSPAVVVATANPEISASVADDQIQKFGFGELYSVKAMRCDILSPPPPSRRADPSRPSGRDPRAASPLLYGRVCLHENGSDTRTLRVTATLDANEAMGDWEEGHEEHEAQAADAAQTAATAAGGAAGPPQKLLCSLPLPAPLPPPAQPFPPPPSCGRSLATSAAPAGRVRRVLLPSEVLAPPGLRARTRSANNSMGEAEAAPALAVHHAAPATGANAAADGSSDGRGGSAAVLCFALELQLHGVSVALIDAVPRELVQLNLRGIRLGVVATPIKSQTIFRLRSLTVDNLMSGSFNPLLLASEVGVAPAAAAGSADDAVSLIVVKRVHPTHSAYEYVGLELAPLHLVLDLALLKALSTAGSDTDEDAAAAAAAGRHAVLLGVSDRLASTFGSLRAQGIAVPEDVLSRSASARAEQLYLQHVMLRPIRIKATVAMGATFVADPSRELLEVLEDLVPHVPKPLEHLLPVLSNLASVTDASFRVSAFEVGGRTPKRPFLGRSRGEGREGCTLAGRLLVFAGSGDCMRASCPSPSIPRDSRHRAIPPKS